MEKVFGVGMHFEICCDYGIEAVSVILIEEYNFVERRQARAIERLIAKTFLKNFFLDSRDIIKTQLALPYLEDHEDDYNPILWIDARYQEITRSSFDFSSEIIVVELNNVLRSGRWDICRLSALKFSFGSLRRIKTQKVNSQIPFDKSRKTSDKIGCESIENSNKGFVNNKFHQQQ